MAAPVDGYEDAAKLLEALPRLGVPLASRSVASKRVVVCGGSVGGLAVAACLRRAGFESVTVLERSVRLGDGAGVGVDDASMGILLGLGVSLESLETTRWIEEVATTGETLFRAPYPYWSTRYADIRRGLAASAGNVRWGSRVVRVEKEYVVLEDGERVAYDALIAADGPRSSTRELVEARELRYAGYTAWRGTVSRPGIRDVLTFVHHESLASHGVLYDIGNGVTNWLVYETRPPSAGAGKTTASVDPREARAFQAVARSEWGEVLGGMIEATDFSEIFRTDVYDLETPLTRLASDDVALVGDAAHAVTPHAAKGSNMAIHDAYVLACAAATASDVTTWLADYSRRREADVSATSRFSRHVGRLRNQGAALRGDFEERVREVPYLALPTDPVFDPVWAVHGTSFYLDHRRRRRRRRHQ
ncbi:hypothetical protein CTAYLR_010032 [Chrysophaeum taylorii]|uniref:Rhodanese domain-containing protein n=1 Tax=Chrysophaeum taylorii TaxID=2483200 RepID=A0AAD7UFS3_9STRA|nr:hypothetical protein CTAYLR_010032 [Chrysophaeum taylorii]